MEKSTYRVRLEEFAGVTLVKEIDAMEVTITHADDYEDALSDAEKEGGPQLRKKHKNYKVPKGHSTSVNATWLRTEKIAQ